LTLDLASKQNVITSTSTLQVGTLNVASAAEVSLIRAPASSNLTLTNSNGTIGLTVNASNGHVGIQRSPLTPLHVNGEARVDGVLSANNSITSTGGGYLGRALLQSISTNATGGGEILLGRSGFAEWTVFGSTNSTLQFWYLPSTLTASVATNGVWTHHFGTSSSSDASLKSPPVDASSQEALAMLKAVSARTYERVDLPNSGSRLGFIAQEVETACPSAWKNLVGTAQIAASRDGPEQTIKTLDYARLVCCLWQANRSMLARIEALEAAAAS